MWQEVLFTFVWVHVQIWGMWMLFEGHFEHLAPSRSVGPLISCMLELAGECLFV